MMSSHLFWKEYCADMNTIGFSMHDENADVYASLLEGSLYRVVIKSEQAELALKVPGKHNVMNALAAIAAPIQLDYPCSR